jgi:hypothetical protein
VATLGYPVHDTSWDQTTIASGLMYASKYTLASAATMTELHAWTLNNGGAAGTLRVVIYADNGSGSPGARIAYTSVLSTATGAADIEVQEAGFNVALPAADYWIGFLGVTGSGTSAAVYAGNGGTYKGIASGVPNPPPDPFGSPTASGSTRAYTVWAVVTAGGGGGGGGSVSPNPASFIPIFS